MKKRDTTPLTIKMCGYITRAYIAFRLSNGMLAPKCPDYHIDHLVQFLNRTLDRDNCLTVYREVWLDDRQRDDLKQGEVYWAEDFSGFVKGEF